TSTLADHLLATRTDLRLAVVAGPEEQQWILDDITRLGHVDDAAGRIDFVRPDDPAPSTDVTVLAWQTAGRDDGGIADLVATTLDAGPSVVLLDLILDDEVHDHDAAEDLTELTARGHGLRTAGE